MTVAKLLAAGTVAYENWWREHHDIPPIANPGEWLWVLENRYASAISRHHGFSRIARDATRAAH